MNYIVFKLPPPQPPAPQRARNRLIADQDGMLEQAINMAELQRDQRIDCYYLDQQSAEQAAKKLAKENPMKQYAVMGVLRVFETTEPKIITKVYSEAGELLPEAV